MSDEMARPHERGRDTFAELVEGGKERLDHLFRASPGLAELAVGTVYGHLSHRPALDERTREAVAIAAIVAADCWESPLSVHVRTGLAAGLTPAEISEILVETAAFAGFPRAVSAVSKLPDLFAEAGSPVPPEPAPREVLLNALDHEELQGLSGYEVQVLTTGSNTAVALFREADGTLVASAQADTTGRKIKKVTVLR
ncbi:carboxymuconolactone decarboxylase family protein [Kutzneria sp. 744]|uniref:carboxymuconolactone decarboxylase family protein n=1 Tax=Kutzneria sp. (strain 744) TaxID=345341 RepID=UPI0004B950AA|nr:carboxymuconolactone decarboxylase family protein [Kutzneria sp. 744]